MGSISSRQKMPANQITKFEASPWERRHRSACTKAGDRTGDQRQLDQRHRPVLQRQRISQRDEAGWRRRSSPPILALRREANSAVQVSIAPPSGRPASRRHSLLDTDHTHDTLCSVYREAA